MEPSLDVFAEIVARLPSWMDEAACQGADPRLFFVHRGESVAPARALCASCHVSRDCLEWAIDQDIEAGIFGGMTRTERRQEARRRAVAVSA